AQAVPAARSARGDRIARAYQQLRELIVWGRLAPGSRVIESDIAERLGVSRTPVRSALHRLQQEGYIVGVGRGSEQRLTVAPLTQDEDRKSTRLNSSHQIISYAVFCLKKKSRR